MPTDILETQRFERLPFPVEAVQVTDENMSLVSRWCKGTIKTEQINAVESDLYILVDVHRPLSDRQTKAYVTDWVLFAGRGFKVYPDKAFKKSFAPVNAEETTVLHQVPPAVPVTNVTVNVTNNDDEVFAVLERLRLALGVELDENPNESPADLVTRIVNNLEVSPDNEGPVMAALREAASDASLAQEGVGSALLAAAEHVPAAPADKPFVSPSDFANRQQVKVERVRAVKTENGVRVEDDGE